MTAERDDELAQLRDEGRKVEAAVQAAVREALIQHKRAGNPIAVWENERVVWIPAEEIEIPDEHSPAREGAG